MQNDPLTPYGNKPMVTPIVSAVNYEYTSFDVLKKITEGKIDGYTYHRDDNPTIRTQEKRIAILEDADDCIICTTGMAAITMVFLTYLKKGDNLIIFYDTYGANYKVSLILEKFSVEVTWIDANDYMKINEILKLNTKMIFCETPSNPLIKVIDIAYLKEQAKKFDALLVIDNTFATPYHQKPLSMGADLVVHSATKALGGHNDLMAGAIACSNKEQYDRLWFTRQAIGTTLDAFSGSLLERGLKTFKIRSEKMSNNALKISNFLKNNKKITELHYPGLETDPGHTIAKKQMKNGYGGMMAFNVGRSINDAKSFINNLKIIKHAVSLGCTESLVCIPVLTTMLYMPVERRLSFGVKDNTVRMSVGIEDSDILIEDIKNALKKV
jgi:cystathionine beta-lyase/cystathionine gamma-synthase